MSIPSRFHRTALTSLAAGLALGACSGMGPAAPEEARPHDARSFTADASATSFAAMSPQPGDAVPMAATSRWAGVLGGAAYQVEVPPNWNGKLVMYAHGYRGTGAALTVSAPPIRRHLIQNGYAWAASSYSKNFYDVRAGVEDTNALAAAFTAIAAKNARPLAAPTRTYLIGHSMGGHITAAAIEAEALATARTKVKYHGAVPMCGVMADTELFDRFTGMQVAALALAGIPSYPMDKWSEVQGLVTNALFTAFPTAQSPGTEIKTTATGARYVSVLKNLTGGERPLFAQGLAYGGTFRLAYGTFGSDGTANGILTQNAYNTSALTYTIDGDAEGTAALNKAAQKLTATPGANRLRSDGLRWIPQINGEITIPVVSLHTLGDMYVPFAMQQSYNKRVNAKGSSQLLVQRAIRGAGHCDFTVAEQAEAFEAMAQWEQGGAKPAGDDVMTPATVAAPSYGCRFTRNTLGPDDAPPIVTLRNKIVATTPACPG